MTAPKTIWAVPDTFTDDSPDWTEGNFFDHPQKTEHELPYFRDPMSDPRVVALVEAAEALRARLDAAMRGRTWSMLAMTDAALFDHALSAITKEPPHER